MSPSSGKLTSNSCVQNQTCAPLPAQPERQKRGAIHRRFEPFRLIRIQIEIHHHVIVLLARELAHL